MISIDELARELARVCPLDADDGEGQVHPEWDAANLHAATHLVENIARYEIKTYSAMGRMNLAGRTSEMAYRMVKDGRKLRNEYLAKNTTI